MKGGVHRLRATVDPPDSAPAMAAGEAAPAGAPTPDAAPPAEKK
jgi:hypothetical protein